MHHGFALVCVHVLDMDEVAISTSARSASRSPSTWSATASIFSLSTRRPSQRCRWTPGALPGPPVMEGEIAEQIRSLVATGFLGPGAFRTEDCWATYRELAAKGVEFIEEPQERFYGIDAAFRDPLVTGGSPNRSHVEPTAEPSKLQAPTAAGRPSRVPKPGAPPRCQPGSPLASAGLPLLLP